MDYIEKTRRVSAQRIDFNNPDTYNDSVIEVLYAGVNYPGPEAPGAIIDAWFKPRKGHCRRVHQGDWLVTASDGRQWVCSNSEFQSNYHPANAAIDLMELWISTKNSLARLLTPSGWVVGQLRILADMLDANPDLSRTWLQDRLRFIAQELSKASNKEREFLTNQNLEVNNNAKV